MANIAFIQTLGFSGSTGRGIGGSVCAESPLNTPSMPTVDISENVYDFSGNLNTNPPPNKFFISILNMQNAPIIPLNLHNNYSDNANIGIRLYNLQGKVDMINVHHNNIYYSSTGEGIYGIKAARCKEIWVASNTIYKTGNSPTDHTPRGISVESSNNILVNSNNITNSGTAIRVLNSSLPNTLQCNIMDSNWDGVRLNNSIIGPQGNQSAASDNQWLNNSNSDIHGGYPSSIDDWYIYPINNQWMTPIYLLPQIPAAANLITANGNTSCNNPCVGNMCRIANWATLIKEQGEYSNLDDETKFIAKDFIYKTMKMDPNLLNSGSPDDSILQLFKDSMESKNSGKLFQVDSLFMINEIIQALEVNNNISPEFNGDYNQKIVNNIYGDTWAKGIFEFTNEQYDLLQTIAYQEPIYGGMAVYDARVMLDVEIDDPEMEVSQRIIPSQIITTKNKMNLSQAEYAIRVYPVPAKDYINIDIFGDLEVDNLAIINYLGQEVLKQKLPSKSKHFTYQTVNFNTGFYQISIKCKNGHIFNEKFIIFR